MADSKRGLASASRETRERVAREGGKASKGGNKTGRKGGQSSNRDDKDEGLLGKLKEIIE